MNPKTWIFALGQAFFSLSVAGNGTLIYGSYLSDEEDIPASAARVALFDTIAAILAALVIIPAMATTGAQLNQGGPGLLFVYLPNLIKSMPGSTLIAMIFFELMQVKPLLGSLLYKGICPPSKPTRTFPPERDF